MPEHVPSAPINTEPVDEQHAAQLGEVQQQIERLTSENNDLEDALTEARAERDAAREERESAQADVRRLEAAIEAIRDALKGL